jgi:hypothetical protein
VVPPTGGVVKCDNVANPREASAWLGWLCKALAKCPSLTSLPHFSDQYWAEKLPKKTKHTQEGANLANPQHTSRGALLVP